MKIKPKLLLILFVLLIVKTSARAQTETYKPSKAKFNSIFGEFGGNGLLLSINYERRLLKNVDLNARIGIGIYGIDKYTTIPFGFDYNLSVDKNKHSFIDFGFGLTYTKAVVDLYVIVERRGLSSTRKDYYLIPIPSVQYKYASNSGFLFKSGLFFPIRDIGVIPYIGFSFGLCF